MSSKPLPKTVTALIQAAITAAGSEAKLGKLAGFSQNAIWYAKRHGRCSAELAVGIEKATNGAISRSRLRPDLYPPAPTAVAGEAA